MRPRVVTFAFGNFEKRVIIVGELIHADTFLLEAGDELGDGARFVNLDEMGPAGGAFGLGGGLLVFGLSFVSVFTLEEVEVRILVTEVAESCFVEEVFHKDLIALTNLDEVFGKFTVLAAAEVFLEVARVASDDIAVTVEFL